MNSLLYPIFKSSATNVVYSLVGGFFIHTLAGERTPELLHHKIILAYILHTVSPHTASGRVSTNTRLQ